MGKFKELHSLLEQSSTEDNRNELEKFFLDKGFSRYSSNIAIKEFKKAFHEINNKGQDNEQNYTKTINTK
jgi:hypothetical protein|tara:strand:+ start:576 stop:785 length:210 start_codon:yes stop_codon:yes gene_type:complete